MNLDRFLDADRKLGLVSAARSRKAAADACVSRRCANCDHWMKKRECPREASAQPTAGDRACPEFALAAGSKRSFTTIMAEAEELLAQATGEGGGL